MFAYCNNNPINLIDTSGKYGDAVVIAGSVWAAFTTWLSAIAAANFWNPLGWVALGVFAAGSVAYGIYYLCETSNDDTQQEDTPIPTELEPPNVTYPGDDPSEAPDGYEWRGPDEQGGKRGGYANPNGKDSWHPDLNHPDGVKPHWDYNDGNHHKWRVFKDIIKLVK